MTFKQFLWFAVAALLLIGTLVATNVWRPQMAHASPTLAVTNVQVNQGSSGPFLTNDQNEPSLAQNPTNPLNLIAGANDTIGEPACTNATPSSCLLAPNVSVGGFYASRDGGQTWPCQGLLDLSAYGEYAGGGDPAQAFDSQGNAYYGVLALPIGASIYTNALKVDFFVAKSTDGGCHYPSAAKVSGASPAIFDDKDAIAADANPNSPFRDNVYAAWTKLTNGAEQILFSRTTDGGATWSNPLPISPANKQANRRFASVKVGPDGSIYVAWFDTVGNQAVERMSISHDGGQTFPRQNITVATVTDDFVNPVPGSNFRQGNRVGPSLAIAADGTLYVAWSNRTGDGPGFTGHAVVMLTRSTDGGMSWSTPIVAGNVSGRSTFFTSLTVDPGGTVDTAFLAVDDVPAGTALGAGVVHYDAYLTRSTDGGASWSPPLKVSTTSSDPDSSSFPNPRLTQFLGDYITAVADGGHVYVVWTDTRNATPCAAVDAFRLRTGPGPNVITQCPSTFGNTDIVLGTVSG